MTRTVLASHWLVVARSEELGRTPLARTVLGTPVVLGRAPEPFALIDRCPHRGVPLSRGRLRAGQLECAYHGWRFDRDGVCRGAPGVDGICPSASVERFALREHAGMLWIHLSKDKVPSFAPPAPLGRGTRRFHLAHELRGHLGDAIENLLDGTHTPFVHAGLLRSVNVQQRFIGKLSVRSAPNPPSTGARSYDVAEVRYDGEEGQAGLVSRLFEGQRSHSIGRYVPPATAELEYHSPRGLELGLRSHFTPTEDGLLRVHSEVHLRTGRLPARLKWLAFRPVLELLAAQDRRIVEAQAANHERFPNARYTYWTADLLRPHIDHWLEHGAFATDAQRTVEFHL
ncbi:MAG: Rieske 2Fe-2S domain-containing protein [Myxococcota bacterium]